MTEINEKNLEEMKRYLFHEISDAERESLEDRFFADEEFFYDLMELENSLVDAYARGELRGDDRRRFEASLEKSPARHEKVANAIALNALVKEEKQAVSKTVEAAEIQPTFWDKLRAFFTLQMSAMQYVSAAVLVFLVIGAGFLLYERARLNRELADLREDQQRTDELQREQEALQNDLKEIREREQNLQDQLDNKEGESEILNEQLAQEKAERERLENELERLKRLQETLPAQNQRPQPRIATVVLLPFSGSKGEGNNNVKTIEIGANTAQITATLQLPKDAAAETFTVRFDGKILASNLKPRTTQSGFKFVTVNLPAQILSRAEDNVITATGDDDSKYNFVLRVQK